MKLVSRVVSFWGKGIDLDLVSPDAPKVNYKLPGFLGKFFELQGVMWTTNAGLTDRHMYDSRPHSWPRLRRGIVSSAFVCFGSVIDWLCRTFGSRIIVRFISLGIPSFGGSALSR